MFECVYVSGEGMRKREVRSRNREQQKTNAIETTIKALREHSQRYQHQDNTGENTYAL
jgi:hypothetical protein